MIHQNGVMEFWSNGVMKKTQKIQRLHFITPLLHYSITPVQL